MGWRIICRRCSNSTRKTIPPQGGGGIALGVHAQAQAHLARVIESAPGNLYARKLLIASLAKSGQVQRAIEVLHPGLRQAPEDVELIGGAGEVSLQTNAV